MNYATISLTADSKRIFQLLTSTKLAFSMLEKISRRHFLNRLLTFPRKQALIFYAVCLQMIFLIFPHEAVLTFHAICLVGDNLHAKVKAFLCEEYIINLLSAEFAKRVIKI